MTVVKVKKLKAKKKCIIKRKLALGNFKNSLEATQLMNKTNDLEKNNIDIDTIKKTVKSNKSIKRKQQQQQKYRKCLKVKGTMFSLERLTILL